MLKYLLGLFKNFLNSGVSFFAMVDNKSVISRKAKINRRVKVYQSNIGSYSYVGSKTELICADIGKFCSIAHRCFIGLGNHSLNHISTSPIFTAIKNATGHSWVNTNTFQEFKRVSIGNDVWIGIGVIVMGGVRIGNGAIIGAGSIVTKDIPDYAIAVGVPAKIIKYRFEPHIIDKLIKMKWWDFPEEKLRKNLKLFQKEQLSLDDLKKLEVG
jgi:acetyltransferase-like isoleucine patch superfamily enzyme